MLSLQPPRSLPHLRASLSPQFLSSQNSLFNIWPGSILQLRIGLDHTLPRATKPLLHIGLKYWQRGGDRFAVKPALSVNPEKRNCKTCTNDNKAAHEEEEGGEQRGTALVGFRVTFAQPMSIAIEFCLSFSNSIAVHSLMSSFSLNIASSLRFSLAARLSCLTFSLSASSLLSCSFLPLISSSILLCLSLCSWLSMLCSRATTFLAQRAQSLGVMQSPAACLSAGHRGLSFRSNHFRCFNCAKLTGSFSSLLA